MDFQEGFGKVNKWKSMGRSTSQNKKIDLLNMDGTIFFLENPFK